MCINNHNYEFGVFNYAFYGRLTAVMIPAKLPSLSSTCVLSVTRNVTSGILETRVILLM